MTWPATKPGAILNKSVKYLPPTSPTSSLLLPTNNLSPLLPKVPTPTVTANSPKFRELGAVIPVDLFIFMILAIS